MENKKLPTAVDHERRARRSRSAAQDRRNSRMNLGSRSRKPNEQGDALKLNSRDNTSGRQVTAPQTRGRSVRRIAIPAAALTAGILAFGAYNAFAETASVQYATAATSSTMADDPSNPNARFLEVVRERPSFTGFTDKDLTGLGHLTCEALDRGATLQDVVDAGRPSIPANDMGWLAGASIGAYCPAHLDLVNSSSNAAGSPANPPSVSPPTPDARTIPEVRVPYQPYDPPSIPGVTNCGFAGDPLCAPVKVPGPNLNNYKGW